MGDSVISDYVNMVDKQYKPTMVKFNQKEAVDNDSESMKEAGLMVMQVGGFTSFLPIFIAFSEQPSVPSWKTSVIDAVN